MTNLKLIISTRTQEEFDRVLQWARESGYFMNGDWSKRWKYYKEETVLSIVSPFSHDIGYGDMNYYKGSKDEYYSDYTFLSFPEFEKQYLTNENNTI